MSASAESLSLFSAYGIEAEYMLVDAASLDVVPLADEVLKAIAGSYVNDVTLGPVGWSNELVMHVIEVKCAEPRPSLAGLAADFHHSLKQIENILAPHGARLLPTAMHPWFNPLQGCRLWPHDSAEIYSAYDRIFSCKGHGWANLQSVHINLPFANDAEFGALHAAIRLVLPLIPAIAAASPLVEGKPAPFLDARIDFYRHNQKAVPAIAGDLIPEAVFSRAAYESEILEKTYAAIRPHDPDGILQYEWLNSRAAIARFDRQAIEIRLMDIQEAPRADIAIVALVVAACRAQTLQHWRPLAAQQQMATLALKEITLACAQYGHEAVITNQDFLALWGVGSTKIKAQELWQHIFADLSKTKIDPLPMLQSDIAALLDRGCLAATIIKHLHGDFSRDNIRAQYRRLADCLLANQLFV